MSLMTAQFPPISKELFEYMDKVYPPVEVIPNITTLEEIMYNAGQRSVIEKLRTYRQDAIITGGQHA